MTPSAAALLDALDAEIANASDEERDELSAEIRRLFQGAGVEVEPYYEKP